MEINFYVYVLTVDGKPFYVGKGSGNRMFWHRKVLSRPHTKEYQRGVYRRMRVILAGRDLAEEKVFETNNETEALLHEQMLIKQFGFENLVNTQSHAFTGRKLKPEVGELIARRLRGRKLPAEVRAKISKSNKGKKPSAATRLKLSYSISSRYGGSFSDEHRAALSVAAKQRGSSQKAVAAMRLANVGRHKDTTKAILSRKQRLYAFVSPTGEGLYLFSNAVTKFLKQNGLPNRSVYRAAKAGFGHVKGWSIACAPL